MLRNAELKVNAIVIAKGEPAYVVKINSPESLEIHIISEARNIVVGIEEIKLIPGQQDVGEKNLEGRSPVLSMENYEIEDIALANERFFVIKGIKTGELSIKAAINRLEMKKSTFYNLLGKFDEQVGPASLLPNKSGRGKSGSRIPKEVDDVISEAIKKIYAGKGSSISKVWQETQHQCTKLGLLVPSKSTVVARLKTVGEKELYRLKHGAEAARQKYGAKPGKLAVESPLDKVQIDHTVVDCILVDDQSREPLFRPWLTLIIDIHTRAILGYYIAFHEPCALSVACALTHAVLPKRRYLDNLGCPNVSHPFYGVPKVIHMDNAREFRSPKLAKACAIHNIKQEWRPIGQKHWGGHIERLIGTMMCTKVHFLPGTTMSNVIARGDYDSEKKSALTIRDFNRWFAGEVEIYNRTVHSSLKCSPLEKWNEAFKDSTGAVVLPKLVTSPFAFKLDFMPEHMRMIRSAGVFLFNRAYWAPGLKAYVGMRKVTIKYDPYNLYTVWARINDSYIELHFSDLTMEPLSYEEHLIKNHMLSQGRPKKMDDTIISIREENERLIANSKATTKRERKKIKAASAHTEHVLNQHFKGEIGGAKRDKRSDEPAIDFTSLPTIYRVEEA